MNYRHAFHAGNFADLLKHAVLTLLLEVMMRQARPILVIDSHAGAGVYDLFSEAARRTGEAAAGIGALMTSADAPGVFDGLKRVVAALNEDGWQSYPGSPLIIEAYLRAGDRLIACEVRSDDHRFLREALRSPMAQALREDGFAVIAARTPKAPAPAQVLILIDPPYEAKDEPVRIAQAVRAALARNRGAVIALWAPLKDLAGFDALLARIEDAACGAPLIVIETRLRAPDDPLRLNGCAMIIVNPPPGLEGPAGVAAAWIAEALGEPSGHARLSRVGSDGSSSS